MKDMVSVEVRMSWDGGRVLREERLREEQQEDDIA